MLTNATRLEADQLGKDLLELRLIDETGTVQVDIERHRIGNADRVRDLDRAAIGQAGCHDVLRQIARNISRRAVNLRRVLARESAAAMRGRTAIRINNDLASGEAGVAIGATNDETAGRVHEQAIIGAHPA